MSMSAEVLGRDSEIGDPGGFKILGKLVASEN